MLMSFPIFKGKITGDETADEELITGVFKGRFKIYKWPQDNSEIDYVTEWGNNLKGGGFQSIPTNESLNFVVRIYCVMANQLTPKDWSGKSDAYLQITMGNQVINDRENYVAKQISPVFGRLLF